MLQRADKCDSGHAHRELLTAVVSVRSRPAGLGPRFCRATAPIPAALHNGTGRTHDCKYARACAARHTDAAIRPFPTHAWAFRSQACMQMKCMDACLRKGAGVDPCRAKFFKTDFSAATVCNHILYATTDHSSESSQEHSPAALFRAKRLFSSTLHFAPWATKQPRGEGDRPIQAERVGSCREAGARD